MSRSNDWNGPQGDQWAIHRSWLDGWLAPFGEAAVRASGVRAGERVLDVGCGAGASSLMLAEAVGLTGHVLGVDVSEALLAEAEARIERPQLRFLHADAGRADLSRLPAFDLIFSRFGVMFFEDPDSAFGRLRAQLRPRGRLTFVCWRGQRENDWAHLPLAAIASIVTPSPPRATGPGPFSLGETDHIRALLDGAGFTDIDIRPFDQSIAFGRGPTREAAIDNAVAMAFEVGPLSRALLGQPEAVRQRASAAVWAAFSTRAGARSVDLAGAAWIVTALSR